MAPAAIGIDLGTTNIVIARDGKVLPIRLGDRAVPSLASSLHFAPTGQIVVGHEARARRNDDPRNTICAAKRILGRGWGSREVLEYRRRYETQLVCSREQGLGFDTRAGVVTPTEVATILLEVALRGAGLDPSSTYAVITVPAAFSESQRDETRSAGERAGLAGVELLEEPVATALAHGRADGARHAAVYDVGGGTFDLCVLDCSLWPVGMLGHGGDLFLGGDDFDEALAAHIAGRLLEDEGLDLRKEQAAFHRLVSEAERVKVELSGAESASLDLARVVHDRLPSAGAVGVDRRDLVESCYSVVRRTFATCDAVFADLDLSPLSMDRLFLAGGGTQMPLVREWVVSYFGVEPSPEVSPFEAIATGASLAAREAFNRYL